VDDPDPVASLRARAHPVRPRILSLLTGAAMSAAEVARELGLTHANASYHLRRMHAAGLIVDAGEESIRGGRARRYRYDVDSPGALTAEPGSDALDVHAMAGELVRRSTHRGGGTPGTTADAELWVPTDAWQRVVDSVQAAMVDLHRAAAPPRTEGTVHVAATVALFRMADQA
jgi:DNA-binding transcriptional ArsR family regulator